MKNFVRNVSLKIGSGDSMNEIVIKGARENNLKNIDLTLPKDKLIVMTGVSGSGKSSLAFDTIYAEGQRRYVESLSAYARQFLGGTEKPDVDSIEGLSPAISIDQKTTSKNPRSTVGTVTEIYDYLRLLYARIGVPYCPTHNIPISSQSVDEIVNKVLEYAQDYLQDNQLYEHWNFKKDGASLICQLLFEEATDINFYVGRAINPAHQNPDLPINFSIKMNLVEELSKCLKEMGKRIKVSYF